MGFLYNWIIWEEFALNFQKTFKILTINRIALNEHSIKP